ncbi:MAG TPA: hypothetical protein VFQ16_03000 [Burkholderiaceae bacterium]|nr:hypothetical protein [Burkholderiaceae bacterium]
MGFKCAPLATTEPIDALELVRTIAAAGIHPPPAIVRLAAGRETDERRRRRRCVSTSAGIRCATATNC